MRRFAWLPVVSILGCAFLACGPSKSTTSILQARSAIRRAQVADAAKKHPYELALAREYYVKAKEEAGYSQFELAEKLAKQAVGFAKQASGEVVATPTPNPDDEDATEDESR